MATPYPGGVSILDRLRPPSATRLAVRVTPDALRHIRAGHPWVYESSITSITEGGHPGDLAVIFGEDRQFVAIGLYDPSSPIRLKILHAGRPRPIDRAFWLDRLTVALHARDELRRGGRTTGFRWVHGENDALPGLVVDVYERTAVVKLYSTAWVAHLAEVVPAMVEAGRVDDVVLRLSRAVQGAGAGPLHEGDALHGEVPSGPVLFTEHGLAFEADVVHGQKTGHFLDQRENRQRVRALASGARVLDVFAATGGFSVYAAAGGATHVTSLDISAPTLAVAERNMAHNDGIPAVRACVHETLQQDAFQALRDLAAARRRFDLVVIDPPSFAQRQSNVDKALRAYRQLTEAGLAVLADGGRLVQASCSSRVRPDELVATMTRGAQLAGWDLNIRERTGHPADHPIGFPEGEYLKAVFAAPRRLPRDARP